MGVVTEIEKKQELKQTIAFVRDEMIPYYAKFFGLPGWLEKPKTDQSPEDIIEQYALKVMPYEKKSVLSKAEVMFRDKNLRIFPQPEQIKAMLGTYDLKETEKTTTFKTGYINLEGFYMERNKSSKLYHKYLFNDYTRAIKYIINELLPDKIGQSEYARVKRQGYSELINLAQIKGLFVDFNSILIQVYKRYHGIEEETLPL